MTELHPGDLAIGTYPIVTRAVTVAAAGADVDAVAYGSGEFDSRHLTFGVGHTVASVTQALADASAPMFIKTPA